MEPVAPIPVPLRYRQAYSKVFLSGSSIIDRGLSPHKVQLIRLSKQYPKLRAPVLPLSPWLPIGHTFGLFLVPKSLLLVARSEYSQSLCSLLNANDDDVCL
jgi:hypothetical protein